METEKTDTETDMEKQYDREQDYEDDSRDEGLYEFISDNEKDLYDEFIKAHKGEFDEMLKEEIIDEERDMDYWREVFCKEEMEQEFRDYCEDEYNNLLDVEETDRSYRNY
jgi:hypothetical protein